MPLQLPPFRCGRETSDEHRVTKFNYRKEIIRDCGLDFVTGDLVSTWIV